MKALRCIASNLTRLALLAFIVIQLAPAWVKIDYTKTDSPCPLHALRASYDNAVPMMSEAEQTAFFIKTGHQPYDPDMICLPDMFATNAPDHAQSGIATNHTGHEGHAHHDHGDNEGNNEDNKQNAAWYCPYCSVRETSFIPVVALYISAPHETSLDVTVVAQRGTTEQSAVFTAYQSRAPPAFS